jgi:hypothetical protein
MKQRSGAAITAALFAVLWVTILPVNISALTITSNAITWTITGTPASGQYVNGDSWVLDSGSGVEVASVSPAPTGSGSTYRNGSVVNPSSATYQGYDGRIAGYSSSLSKTFPLTLHGGQSLVSTQNRTESETTKDICGADVAPANSYLARAAVLTCVSEPPNANDFRPPFCGTSKTTYSKNNLQRGLLPALTISGKPSTGYVATVASYFRYPWLDHKQGWECRMMHPTSNMPNYGRDIGHAVSIGTCLLLLDYNAADSESLFVNMVQTGIDLYAMAQNGTNWPADGGHSNGRKWLILFAGIMLDNTPMKGVSAEFGEDDQTYYGDTPSANAGQAHVAYWGRNCSSAYTAACSGSGTKDCRVTAHDADGCQDYRNCCTSYTWVGEALAIRIMNARTLWNHESFFSYVDRWMGYGNDPEVCPGDYIQPGSTSAPFIGTMWNTYRAAYEGPNTPPVPEPNTPPDPNIYDANAVTYVTPTIGGDQVVGLQAPMITPEVYFEGKDMLVLSGSLQPWPVLDWDDPTIPVLRPLTNPEQAFDPYQPYAVLTGKSYNFQYGWGSGLLDEFDHPFPAGSSVYVKVLSQTAGLETYYKDGADDPMYGAAYYPLFATPDANGDPSRDIWRWNKGTHYNMYAMPKAYYGRLFATYEVYVGDVNGAPMLHDVNDVNEPYGSSIVTLRWIRPCPYILQGDLSLDCRVDFRDVAILAAQWALETCSSPEWCDKADITNSGFVDFSDASAMVEDWLRDCFITPMEPYCLPR